MSSTSAAHPHDTVLQAQYLLLYDVKGLVSRRILANDSEEQKAH